MTISILLLFIGQYVLLIRGDELLVTIDQGTVKGHKHPTRSLYEFHGIPYATLPTGEDRFKAPLPAPSWEGILDAVDDIVLCPQITDLEFSDTCLIVNVFVPENNNGLKPVVVYIHGGGFIVGYGNAGLPYDFAERDVVAVNLNYRLGVHGFLCLNTEKIPGNAGLKDQIAALRWVKKNIQAFGGDPDDVTIAGYSAGSVSTELLMLSPAANGLFNKVILESGNAIASWGVNPNGFELAQNTASKNGVSDVYNITHLEDFYLSLSYHELLSLIPNDFTQLIFGPCIESNYATEETVITEPPYEVLLRGDYAKVPLLTGYTDSEGLLFYNSKEILMADMNENFSSRFPPNLMFYTNMDEIEVANFIKKTYFDEEVITDDSIRGFIDYFTDSFFSYWCIKSAQQHALNAGSVYLYEFSYVNAFHKLITPGLGASHCAQTEMSINLNGYSQFFDENDKIVQNRIVDMWSDFIKFGEPTASGTSNYWERLNPERMNYLAINFETENKVHPLKERMQVWEKIYGH